MYVRDSAIEAKIEKDSKKQHLEGRIEVIEHQLRHKSLHSGLQERLKRLRGELKLLPD